ncbi:hypothetical protein VK792_12945 [Mesobacterium sp. TK19101]|uniref:Uncharacterized protein n=1 Tax=Mesobacterium hydrothermale TaxID=3111907 RepID=A0ABU6HJW5_9RHOB|nr:hypothetical protein [Mesobacterium sp. TK19101]MEC3862194.1 hypothetical protein [Mesobacterium sp. TK19101]
MNDLEARLLAAHARGDTRALVGLYTEAGEHANSAVAQGFYLTHAYVYALELGDVRATGLHARLVAMGRET